MTLRAYAALYYFTFFFFFGLVLFNENNRSVNVALSESAAF